MKTFTLITALIGLAAAAGTPGSAEHGSCANGQCVVKGHSFSCNEGSCAQSGKACVVIVYSNGVKPYGKCD